MKLEKLKLVTDWPGRIYLPRNKRLIKDVKKFSKSHRADCDTIEILFTIFSEAGWIKSSHKFNDENGGFYSFKTDKLRVYGRVFRVTGGSIFVITEVFIKQGKSKEHKLAIDISKERMREYEKDINRIQNYQKENPPHNPKNN